MSSKQEMTIDLLISKRVLIWELGKIQNSQHLSTRIYTLARRGDWSIRFSDIFSLVKYKFLFFSTKNLVAWPGLIEINCHGKVWCFSWPHIWFNRLSNKTLKYPVVCNIGKLMPLDTETTVLTMLLSVYHTLPLMK